MTPNLTELAQTAAEETPSECGSSDGGGIDHDFERTDLSGRTWVKQQPTTAVRGKATALAFQPDFEQDDDDNWIPQDSGDFVVMLEDPSVYTDDEDFEGTFIFAPSDVSDNYRVYNADDADTELQEEVGQVVFGSNSIVKGEVVDDFEEDEIALKATGSSGKSIATTLDVKGKGGAHAVGYYDGQDVELHDGGFPEHSGHLYEYNPDDDAEKYQRVAVSDAELRDDVDGREVIVMLHRTREVIPDSDSDSYWATVLANLTAERTEELSEQYAEDVEEDVDPESFLTEIDGETFIRLKPTNEFDRSRGNLIESPQLQWRRLDPETINAAREEAGLDPYDFGGS